MRERAQFALLAVGVLALIAAGVMLWQASVADRAVRMWEFGQTLQGVHESAPTGGTPWRIGAAVSGGVGLLSLLAGWVIHE